MKVDRFITERERDWRELDDLLRAKRRGRRDVPQVLRLAALYRGAAADLALARRSHPGDPVVTRLESLVARARQLVYAEEPRRGSMRTFFGRTYWVRVREQPRPLLLAIALLIVPAVLGAAWALADPGAALGLIPEEFQGAVEPVGDTGMTAAQTTAFSSAVMTNNIQVTFLAFAAGILLGLGTALVVAYNGLILGTVAGGAIGNGNGLAFAEFVTAHGVIELSCIAVAAAAGLRIGNAIVAPGPRTRAAALVAEARPAAAIVLGTIPWVILAGIIEGFVTRAGFGLVPGIVLGVAVGAAYWSLVIVRGRPRPRRRRSRAPHSGSCAPPSHRADRRSCRIVRHIAGFAPSRARTDLTFGAWITWRSALPTRSARAASTRTTSDSAPAPRAGTPTGCSCSTTREASRWRWVPRGAGHPPRVDALRDGVARAEPCSPCAHASSAMASSSSRSRRARLRDVKCRDPDGYIVEAFWEPRG